MEHKITDGPSNFDLAVALFHKPKDGQMHGVSFTLEGYQKVLVVLLGCVSLDENRESWAIQGYLIETMEVTNVDELKVVDFALKKFQAKYNTNSKTGTFRVD